MKKFITTSALSSLFLGLCFSSHASSPKSVEMFDLATGDQVGTIVIHENDYGVVFSPKLSGLLKDTSSLHGFHIHQNPSCDSSQKNGKTVLGGAAGGHYDAKNTDQHGLPWSDNNHLGDLPPLFINDQGTANSPVLAPRLKISDLSNRALMIHAGGDNHSDHPKALGGGGARLVCGVIN